MAEEVSKFGSTEEDRRYIAQQLSWLGQKIAADIGPEHSWRLFMTAALSVMVPALGEKDTAETLRGIAGEIEVDSGTRQSLN